MRVSSVVTLAVMVFLSATVASAKSGARDCLDPDRNPTLSARSECLRQIGDPKAIEAIYRRIREMVSSEGRQALSRDEFWSLAQDAGAIAARTSHLLLLEKVRSRDIFDQVFGLEALRHVMLEIATDPSEALPQRTARLHKFGPEVRSACMSRAASNDEDVLRVAQNCLEQVDETAQEVQAEAESTGAGKKSTSPPEVPNMYGPREGGGALSERTTRPMKFQLLNCLHGALGLRLELCFRKEIARAIRAQERSVPLLIRENTREDATRTDKHWTSEASGERPIVAWFDLKLAPHEVFLRDPPRPVDLQTGQFLIFVPIVRPDHKEYDLARGVLLLFDSERRAITHNWASPPCLNGCLGPKLNVVEVPGGKEAQVTLSWKGGKRVYRVRWSDGRLESVDR